MVFLKVMCWFLGILIAILVDVYVAKKAKAIVRQKGYDEDDAKSYFWFSFWLMPVAILLVIALPDIRTRKRVETLIDEVDALKEKSR